MACSQSEKNPVRESVTRNLVMFWCESWSPRCWDVPPPPLGGINPQGGEPWQPRRFSSELLTGGTSRTPPPLRRCLPIQQCQLITRRTELWWTDDMPCIKYPGLAWAVSQRDATDLPSFRSCHRGISSSDTSESRSPSPSRLCPGLRAGTELPASVFTQACESTVLFCVIYTYKHMHICIHTCVCIQYVYACVCIYMWRGVLFEISGFLTDSDHPWW